jgi:hypothetical protein
MVDMSDEASLKWADRGVDPIQLASRVNAAARDEERGNQKQFHDSSGKEGSARAKDDAGTPPGGIVDKLTLSEAALKLLSEETPVLQNQAVSSGGESAMVPSQALLQDAPKVARRLEYSI